MKSGPAAVTAVAAGLSCTIGVAGSGFFGPLPKSSAHGLTGPRGTQQGSKPEASSRWLGRARRGSRQDVADSLYDIRGGASGDEAA